MTYAPVQPPLTGKFRDMPKKELKAYYVWFQNILLRRVDELTRAVWETAGFETWQADFTPASLELLGLWFAKQVEMRPRTQDEIDEIASHLSFPIEIPEWDLTTRTFSLAMDVGMYLSQVFLKSHPTLRWDQPFGGKSSVDYGQPVLTGFSVTPFNPVRMLVTLSYSVATKRKSSKGLRDLYDYWVKMISGIPKQD